jgi:small subunit ribosomal protein S10|tara:strand:- start:25988 stop:26323 length:336 start_codon:yes stop_codon:yes gene_type:complete
MLTKQNQKIRIRLKSFNHELLTESCEKIIQNLQNIKAQTVGPIPLPINKRIYCVLRSPHVDKDSREHFEIRIHKRILDIRYDSSVNIMELLSKLDLPAGVLYQINLLVKEN